MFVGAEAPSITDREENGDNDYIYRASFGVDTAADKFVSYMVDEGVESVDVIYKNDEFGAGGREAYVAAFEEAGIDVGLDIQVQPDQVDQSAEVTQLAGGDADAIFVFMTEIETAAFLDEYQAQGLDKPLYGGDVLSAASTIALAQPGRRRRHHHPRRPQRLGAGVQRLEDRLRRVPSRRRSARSQQHQGLHDRPRGQGGRRADRRVRQQPVLGHAALRRRSPSRTSPACCSTSATTATATSTARATSCRSSTAPVRSSRRCLRSTTSTSGVARQRGQSAGGPPPDAGGGPPADVGGVRHATMTTFLQISFSGLATGAIFAVAAVGFALLWQTAGAINFAHGEFIVLPAVVMLLLGERRPTLGRARLGAAGRRHGHRRAAPRDGHRPRLRADDPAGGLLPRLRVQGLARRPPADPGRRRHPAGHRQPRPGPDDPRVPPGRVRGPAPAVPLGVRDRPLAARWHPRSRPTTSASWR